jgi:sulfofructosephosphate aldolase
MTPTLDAIARPSGALAMVAMDQRESLRTMFDAAGAGRPDDGTVVDFKLAVADALTPLASGFLVDRHGTADGRSAFDTVRTAGLPGGCGLILAADALEQEVGGPVEDTELDEVVAAPGFDLTGVAALKLLIIWRRDERRAARVELARRFVELAAQRGVLSVLEPVVRVAPGEDVDDAIVEAARELSPLRPSLYKAQVPRGGRGPADELEAACAKLGEAVTGPWVVLSQGVDRDDFPAAVRAACRGGASGFLAGRALWSDVVGRPDAPAALRELSVPRLRRLTELVDAEATPWSAR